MQILDSYPLPPGQCKTCGGTNVPTIDTDREIDQLGYEGRMYVCVECVGAMADAFGWLSPTKRAELEARADKAEEERDAEHTRANQNEMRVDGLLSEIARLKSKKGKAA